MHTEKIPDIELLLGHTFRDKSLIVNALSHSSIKTDHRPSNERLEFLGDSVLGMIVSEALYRRYPEDDEGTLTRIKSQAVSRAALQRIAVAMGLDRYILVGKGVLKREIPASLLGNLFEAIVGAIYLDSGLAASRKFILRHLDVVIEEIVEDRAERNYKSMLQHYCQRELGSVPSYRVIRESGPAHSRAFEVAVVVSGTERGRAKAASKKEAEQGAARAAMIHFRAVDEKPKDQTRGAGTIVRVGPEAKKSRRRGGRGRGKDKDKEKGKEPEKAKEKAKEKEKEAAPAAQKKRSRRRSRGRGGSKKKEAEAAPKAPEAKPEEKPKKTGRKRKRKRSSRGKKAGSGGGADASAPPAA